MKKVIFVSMMLTSGVAMAQLATPVSPQAPVPVTALKWADDPDCSPGNCPNGIHHVPGMLPGHPTSATIWPRVVKVPCTEVDGNMKCDYPSRSPGVGRAEYVMYEPVKEKEVVVNVPPTKVVVKEVLVKEVVKEVTIVKEVPPKKIRE